MFAYTVSSEYTQTMIAGFSGKSDLICIPTEFFLHLTYSISHAKIYNNISIIDELFSNL